jgi:molybdenum cofactor cytidylyltransferase
MPPPGEGAALVLLAAGESKRMGQPKQLLAWHGTTLVRHAAQTALASHAHPVIVVVGSQAAQVRAELQGLDLHIVTNPDYASGQASSLQAGLMALPATSSAVVVMLVDQPLVRAKLIDHLIARWQSGGAPLVVPCCAGRRGNPVLIGRELFEELRALQGDAGARVIFERHAARIAWVEADEAVLLDADSPEAYARLVNG